MKAINTQLAKVVLLHIMGNELTPVEDWDVLDGFDIGEYFDLSNYDSPDEIIIGTNIHESSRKFLAIYSIPLSSDVEVNNDIIKVIESHPDSFYKVTFWASCSPTFTFLNNFLNNFYLIPVDDEFYKNANEALNNMLK